MKGWGVTMMSTAVKIISDGVIKMDGGSMFGQVPKVAWENTVVTDRKNRMTLGLNCLLLQVGGQNVLVDTGIGSKEVDQDKENLSSKDRVEKIKKEEREDPTAYYAQGNSRMTSMKR